MTDRYRVAVVVTTEVDAVDYADAAGIVERAVKQTLVAGTPRTYPPLTIEATRGDDVWPVAVRGVEELSRALRNGGVRLEVAPPRLIEED